MPPRLHRLQHPHRLMHVLHLPRWVRGDARALPAPDIQQKNDPRREQRHLVARLVLDFKKFLPKVQITRKRTHHVRAPLLRALVLHVADVDAGASGGEDESERLARAVRAAAAV